jgi:pyridoxal phosphate-dependent aminotransferase EpsN
MTKRIYLSPPSMSDVEKKLLLEAFDSNWIAPIGPKIDEFEKKMADYLGVKYAVALNSGSSSLHLALRVAGIKKYDNVLCPSLTFAATANVIIYENACPVFLDSDSKTWVLDTDLLSYAIKKFKPKALITVDLYGQSCDYDSIIDICKSNDVKIIEDSAEALGSSYKNKKCGTFGDMGIISFNGNKIITTSTGGMLLSDNREFIKKAKYLSTQAREPLLHYEHKELGYNYRMSNLLAAVGLGQLERFDILLNKRRHIFNKYYNSLSHFEGLKFLKESEYCKSNRWLTTLTLDEKILGFDRSHLISILEKENLESRPVWKPMHLQPFYKKFEYVRSKENDFSAELFHTGICLPSGSNLSAGEQSKIINLIQDRITKNP